MKATPDNLDLTFKSLWGASTIPFGAGAKPAFDHPAFEAVSAKGLPQNNFYFLPLMYQVRVGCLRELQIAPWLDCSVRWMKPKSGGL
jgi:hypothetical protein